MTGKVSALNGGALIAEVLVRQGVKTLFTLCGGHISPILVEAKKRGIRVIDTRHEATAVFAADATARLTGIPGVAAVTAGPGVTNTLTAIQNARMARSPVVLLGGATATVLKGRGALQDIDQLSLLKPAVKWQTSPARMSDLVPALEEALRVSQEGIPGPVFVECPVDLLYDESLVRSWYTRKSGGSGLVESAIRWYLERHLDRLFQGADSVRFSSQIKVSVPGPEKGATGTAALLLSRAKRPVIVASSQTVSNLSETRDVAASLASLNVPCYLSGMARGLLGAHHPLQMRHKRKEALREADFVLLAGTPCDFRLDYGRNINHDAVVVAVNRDARELKLNRRPALGVVSDAGLFLQRLASEVSPGTDREGWISRLRERDGARDKEIEDESVASTQAEESGLNPVFACAAIEDGLPGNSVLVADGGDFVATASYIVRPRGPLTWLDPGVFGTLGAGAGFALGAALAFPQSSVVLLWGDGSCGYGLSELDTFVRHGLAVIAVVGNDAGWTQIAREQIDVLKDDVGTVLRRSDYHIVAEGFGATGILVSRPSQLKLALAKALSLAAEGWPVLLNLHLGKTAFRKGSISM